MAQLLVTIDPPNSGQGDPLYTAYDKINSNFTEVYALLAALPTFVILTQAEYDLIAPGEVGVIYYISDAS